MCSYKQSVFVQNKCPVEQMLNKINRLPEAYVNQFPNKRAKFSNFCFYIKHCIIKSKQLDTAQHSQQCINLKCVLSDCCRRFNKALLNCSSSDMTSVPNIANLNFM